jgi:hypothetical protein
MKRLLIFVAVLLLICGAAFAGYLFGHQRGFENALVRANSDFVGALDALQKLRAGDIQGGINRVESTAFSCANMVYGSDRARCQAVGKMMLGDIRHYRQTYRTNSSEWTAAEQNLELKLTSWK